jgi:hypothetical protein
MTQTLTKMDELYALVLERTGTRVTDEELRHRLSVHNGDVNRAARAIESLLIPTGGGLR